VKNVNLVDFRTKMSQYMDEMFFHGERYVIMKNGKPKVIAMSIKEYDELVEYVRICDKRREVK
jgi:prevent-host-death family protein